MNLFQFMFNICIVMFVAFVYFELWDNEQKVAPKVKSYQRSNSNSATIQQHKVISNRNRKNSAPQNNDQLNSCLRACQDQEHHQRCIKACIEYFSSNTQNSRSPSSPVILIQTIQKESELANTYIAIYIGIYIIIGIVCFLAWQLFQEKYKNMKILVKVKEKIKHQEIVAEIQIQNIQENLQYIRGDLANLNTNCKNLNENQAILADTTKQLCIGLQSCGDRIYQLSGALENELVRREDFEQRQIEYNYETSRYLANDKARLDAIANSPPQIRYINYSDDESSGCTIL